MRRLFVAVLLALLMLPSALSASGLTVVPTSDYFSVLPGSVVTIPIRIINPGNESVQNVSIELLWGVNGSEYRVEKTVTVAASESRVVDLNLRVPFIGSDNYTALLIVRGPNFTSERNVTISVKRIVQYSLNVSALNVTYGLDEPIRVEVTSYSNDPIQGDIEVYVYDENGTLVQEYAGGLSVGPGKRWERTLIVSRPRPGRYRVVVKADVSGVREERQLSFTVAPREFRGYVFYTNGRIEIRVLLKNGSPVRGALVDVNGTLLHTDSRGEAFYTPRAPGWYSVGVTVDGVRRDYTLRVPKHYSVSSGFEDGVVWVRVLSDGKPSKGVAVEFNGQNRTTNSKGYAKFYASKPGMYRVTVYTPEGRITVFVPVGKLFAIPEIRRDVLVVRVRDSSGNPVGNATVSVVTSSGEKTFVTGGDGTVRVPLKGLSGTVMITASASGYIGDTETISLPPAAASSPSNESSSQSSPGNVSNSQIPPAAPGTAGSPVPKGELPWIASLLLSLAVFSGATYISIMRPHVIEEKLDRYYFVRVKAPRMRALKDFRWEGGMNAVEVRATRGTARIEGSKVVWSIDELEPGGEAVLQVVLG
ncbi:carboxypeptidase regulatory-like domain-containing protein [Thermococcus sp.]|uniref:carboxypeptidase regulatory-like domain-containing protein n=1 Tax=Thermococcus sp. TaxID=35749 RepID=UPI00262D8475|nr:carboxypeptidase regulatory-like domain-containing protein [Thermococcus sp.]